ncbi:hypothetical protein [Rhabdaerophilum sp. SD176]|uniref:hypothetical protein n=1 Tax=Rhabdaerophilum sp. SD176 TaxID=2983548 RepID=UPI0024E03E65|nr:hypothetical protein [Rhabdaerophilum sp. SD176]
MNEEDWREIVQLIQVELRNIGHDEIADLSNYEQRKGSERFLLPPKYLVNEMLEALRRDISVRSPSTLRQSFERLEELIDEGVRPKEAIVWFDPERALVEGREPQERLEGSEGASHALEDLEKLIGQLVEIRDRGDLE